MKKILWLVLGVLMTSSLVIAACAPAATPTAPAPPAAPTTPVTPAAPTQEKAQKEAVKPSTEAPKYGGIINRALSGDITSFDFFNRSFAPGITFVMTNEGLVEGDWTKGPAGGYGTNETDWAMGYDVVAHQMGILVENWKWLPNFESGTAAVVYQIRRGIRFALNQNSEASRLVAGREMTADDVVYTLRLLVGDSRMYVYHGAPELRTAEITKTAPWEVSAKVPIEALVTGFYFLNYWGRPVPPEVIKKYGDMADWRNSVGTGPFMLVDNIPGSAAVLKKNDSYWMKDPIGPGKGSQLPYIDGVRLLILPDASTRMAALRTAKIDQMYNISWEDAIQLRKTTPGLKEMAQPIFGVGPRFMRVDMPPFNDVRVRRALLMATDLEAIRQGLFGGLGEIHTWPWPATKGYEATFLALDDPRMPQSVKELYTYNPEKAKALLKEAGYPTGFKTTALMTQTEVDYYSILKDQWAKAGVELDFMIRETGAKNALLGAGTHPPITTSGVPQARMFYRLPHLIGTDGISNPGMINDPTVNEAMKKMQKLIVTDEQAAMKIWGEELMSYVLGQAFAIPTVGAPNYNYWWPWIKNYSGEIQLGPGLRHQDNWFRFIWLDQEQKKSMGFK